MKALHILRYVLPVALFAAGSALAQIEIKFGHVGEPGSLFAKSAEEYAKRANAKLGGKAKVVVFGSSQLGGDKELLQKLKLGTVDLALPSTVMSSESDLFGIFEMPYLVKDRKHMQAIEKAVFWSQLAPEAEKKGLKVLAVWENGYRHITNNKHPIVKPAGPAGHQAARARRQVAREDVPGLRREPEPDEVLRGVHRAADRRDGRPGEPVLADRLRQVPGSPEIPVADRARLHARLHHGRGPRNGRRSRPTCARCSKTPPRKCSRSSTPSPRKTTTS